MAVAKSVKTGGNATMTPLIVIAGAVNAPMSNCVSGRSSRWAFAFASDAAAGLATRAGVTARLRSASRPAKPAASAPPEISILRRENPFLTDRGPSAWCFPAWLVPPAWCFPPAWLVPPSLSSGSMDSSMS